jgi:hypothetical protein
LSIENYQGTTFVAFLDISGFKQMMNNKEKVYSVLQKFYGSLFDQVGNFNLGDVSIKVNVVAVSDSAIIFLSKGQNENVPQNDGLPIILRFISTVNQAFANHNNHPFLTVCSVAYGDFTFYNWRERDRLSKNCLKGDAYLKAYLDTENEVDKLKPGQCRIIKKGLTIDLTTTNFALRKKKEYFYYYWRLSDTKNIKSFDNRYEEIYDKLYSDLIRLHADPEQFIEGYVE